MKYLGAHVSASGGVDKAPENAGAIGARAFALFTKNQKQWYSNPLSLATIKLFRENCDIRRQNRWKSRELHFSMRCRDVNSLALTG
jgi:endonuclease IV